MTSLLSHKAGQRFVAGAQSKTPAVHWRGGAVESIRHTTPSGGEYMSKIVRHALLLTPDGAFEKGETRFDNKVIAAGGRPKVASSFVPAGCLLTGWRSESRSNYAAIFLDPHWIFEVAELSGRNCDFEPSLEEDALTWQLGMSLRAECEAGSPMGIIYTETIAAALAMQLLRQHSNLNQTLLRPKKGGLSGYTLRQATEYMMARLSDDLTLTELSGIAGLSPAHFARSFRISTGHPPHRWLTLQRVARAKELLLDRGMELSAIALLCGFAEQSHFTRVFRQLTGTSPGAWRRDRKL